jgi:hypothetical protein
VRRSSDEFVVYLFVVEVALGGPEQVTRIREGSGGPDQAMGLVADGIQTLLGVDHGLKITALDGILMRSPDVDNGAKY